MEYIVELHNIRKEFPGVIALDGVNLFLSPGRVHALVGENGAGKSTLMKILSGSYVSYEGKMVYQGQEIHLKNEKDALQRGIAIVPQELNPIPELSIAQNVFLGREPQKAKGIIDYDRLYKITGELLSELGLSYDPRMKMRELSIAQKQMIEILKAISRNCKVIILDEPTSALTSVETRQLFAQIDKLKQKGIAIVFISHKLDEIFGICEDVSVLRDGHFIGSDSIANVTQDQLIAMMVGREVKNIYPPLPQKTEDTMLEVKNLTSRGVFQDISFTLHKGEILGIAGMMGAGRSEIMRCIFGMDPYDSGEIVLAGIPLKIRSIRDAIRSGIVMVTEDRATYGFVPTLSIRENIVLPNNDIFSRNGLFLKNKISESVKNICEKLKIKASSPETLAGTLSGGNKQKVVLSKWLVRDVKVLIMDEPTRGIDVGAKQEIYQLITELAGQGMAVILISSEMPEVLAMSHRILVVADGRMIGEFEHDEATQDKIMKNIVESRNESGKF